MDAQRYTEIADAVDAAGLERDERLFLVYYLLGSFEEWTEDCSRDIQSRGGEWGGEKTLALLKAGELERASMDIRRTLASHLF